MRAHASARQPPPPVFPRSALGDENGVVRVVRVDKPETLVCEHVSLGAAVTRLEWVSREAGNLLAASTAAGGVYVLNPDAQERFAELIAPSADGSFASSSFAWSPDGSSLAVGVPEGVRLVGVPAGLGIIEAQEWKQAWEEATAMPSSAPACLTWSPSGRYLACLAVPRSLLVWDGECAVVLQGPVPGVVEGKASSPSVSPIHACVWSADGYSLPFIDTTGHVGVVRVQDLAHMAAGAPVPAPAAAAVGKEVRAAPAPAVAPVPAARPVYLEREAEDSKSDEEADAPHFSLAAEKLKLGFADIEGGEGGLGRVESGDEEEGEESGPRMDAEAVRSMLDRRLGDSMEAAALLAQRHMEEVHGLVPTQAPFQSGATRFKDAASSRAAPKRYLQWNFSGSITARAEAMSTVIDVDFTDSTAHRSHHFEDTTGFTLAALTHNGAIFASGYTPPAAATEAGRPGKLLYKSFGTAMAAGSEWERELIVDLPRMPEGRFPRRLVATGNKRAKAEEAGAGGEGPAPPSDSEDSYVIDTSEAAESPVALGLGDGWIAVGTDRELLHFIRTSGAEDASLVVDGSVVTVAASGSLAAVVYHRGLPDSRRQRLACDVYRVPPLSSTAAECVAYGQLPESSCVPIKLASVPLPLPAGETLQWLGFSSTGLLCAHHTGGGLMCLHPGAGWAWMQLSNTRAAALQAANLTAAKATGVNRVGYWPVGVVLAPPTAGQLTTEGAASDKNARIPVLAAIFCRGGSLEPPVAYPRPLTVLLALKPSLFPADTAASAYDGGFITAELSRLQRAWCNKQGLLRDGGGASVTLAAINAAATASLHGNEPVNPVVEIDAARYSAADGDGTDCVALDRATFRAIVSACEASRDARAMQLATRLHLPTGIKVAIKATQSRPAVSERLVQLMLVKQAEAEEAGQAAAAPQPVQRAPAPAPAPALRAGYGLSGGASSSVSDSHTGSGSGSGSGMGAAATGSAYKPGPTFAPAGTSSGNVFKKQASPPRAGKRKAEEGLAVLRMASPVKGNGQPTTAGKFLAGSDKRPRER
jgi:hypothetical protein